MITLNTGAMLSIVLNIDYILQNLIVYQKSGHNVNPEKKLDSPER